MSKQTSPAMIGAFTVGGGALVVADLLMFGSVELAGLIRMCCISTGRSMSCKWVDRFNSRRSY